MRLGEAAFFFERTERIMITEGEVFSTRQAAEVLGVRPHRLSHAVWDNRVPAPKKSPGGDYVWSRADLERAAHALLNQSLER